MGLEAHQPFDCFRHPHRCQRHTSRKRQENVAENCAMPDYSVFSNRLRNLPIKKNVTRPRPIGVSVGTAHFFFRLLTLILFIYHILLLRIVRIVVEY